MRRFFRLLDDMTTGERWHVGDVLTKDGTEPPLCDGVAFQGALPLVAEVTNPGPALEFSLTSFAVPLVTKALADRLTAIAGSDLQCLPVEIAGGPERFVLNALRTVQCLDERRSDVIKWTEEDDRPDKLGDYCQVINLTLIPELIPPAIDIFRVAGWTVALIVSETVKLAMEATGCAGAVFEPVT